MHIWLVTIGEPLTCDGPNERLLRTGILADHLAEHGHDVLWWTSTFDHIRKRHRFDRDVRTETSAGYAVWLLHANRYPHNVSLRRLLNHRRIAQSFRRRARHEPRPDLIVCSWPTVELCAEAVSIGKRWNVPVVLDIRDLWPNAITDLAPRLLRPAVRYAMRRSYQRAHYAASCASAIIGITDQYVDWGLAYAGRARTSMDRDFPLGYVEKSPTPAEVEAAERFWAEHGVAADKQAFVACWFGTIGRNSELTTVIEAARQLERLGKPARFVLCGMGPELDRSRRLAEDCPNVLLPGWIDAPQIWTLLRMSSVGLAPYVSNDNFVRNLPNKPVEYLSASLPILSSLEGVLARLLAENDCGITYPNGRAEALAAAIAKIMDDPARRTQMSENARSLYQSRFVADTVYSEMRSHLEQIARVAGTKRVHIPAPERMAATERKP